MRISQIHKGKSYESKSGRSVRRVTEIYEKFTGYPLVRFSVVECNRKAQVGATDSITLGSFAQWAHHEVPDDLGGQPPSPCDGE